LCDNMAEAMLQLGSMNFSEKGLRLKRKFTKENVHPYDEISWEKRDAIIKNERGEIVFEQRGVEIPAEWSQNSTNIVVSKYFRGKLGAPERETSARQMIDRVVKTIGSWGRAGGYFANEESAKIFEGELAYMLVNQMFSFNSPVWFNVGVDASPQTSACFILDIKDTMQDILRWYATEGMIFKFGSGSGINISPLRGSKEFLAGGGNSSGPVAYMKAADVSAGTIKSGGKTRRAAKMVILNSDHPDIVEFINCKATEEKKAWALIDAGYDGGFNVPGGAYDSVFFQNANHSVRATDEFMKAVERDDSWQTKFVKSGAPAETYKSRELIKMIAEAVWVCGDPGMQFDTTVNMWHTCKASGRINGSNPCSEYMFIDNTSCNLASINLMKFKNTENGIDIEKFEHAVDLIITAMEVLVSNSSYPTEEITKNSRNFRPLGFGYANLGALLMSRGLAYDSEEGRNFSAAITSLLCGRAYLQSSALAKTVGPFNFYRENEKSFLEVIGMHTEAAQKIYQNGVPENLLAEAKNVWASALEHGKEFGFRNSQASVLAPTGTIGFMMDCDTTGVEPDIALVKYKRLVGGGMMKIVNRTVPEALENLGYNEEQRKQILDYIEKNDTIEGAPFLREEDLKVFDCAFKPANGKRAIHYMGHVKMMAAVQPFLSGAISKTVNMPAEATPEEIAETYLAAWKMGLKAIAIYRDGSKRTQPLSTKLEKKEFKANKRKLPDERQSVTHKFNINGHEGYITVGLYEDGQPGELFIKMSKQGSTISGIMDSFALAISMALQYGVPLKELVGKFIHTRFEPSGITDNKDIKFARSVMDYIFTWMALKYLNSEDQEEFGVKSFQKTLVGISTEKEKKKDEKGFTIDLQEDSPPCFICGSIMIRSGSCYKCVNCGSTSGCS